MYEPRRILLINKAKNYAAKLDSAEYAPDGKAAYMLSYQIDTMAYGLSGINSEEWPTYLKVFKEAKYILRIISKDENVKQENYKKAAAMVSGALDKYLQYLTGNAGQDGEEDGI